MTEETTHDMRYSRAIVAIRGLKGWTQTDLAARMGTTPETISRIESGKHDATRHVHAVCEAAGLRLGEFDTLLDIWVAAERRLRVRAARDVSALRAGER